MTTANADLRVGNLMTIDPITIGPEESASRAETLLKTYRISGLPVVDGGDLVGVLSQSDLMVAHSSEIIGAHWERMKVRHVMSSPALTVHAAAPVAMAARQMILRHVHRLVVVGDDGRPVGVVTPLDLLRSLLEDPETPMG